MGKGVKKMVMVLYSKSGEVLKKQIATSISSYEKLSKRGYIEEWNH